MTSNCFVAGEDGAIQHTVDGTHWTQQVSAPIAFYGLSCFDASHCSAVGVNTGTTPAGCVTSTSDGNNWSGAQCSSAGTSLFGVSCAATNACYAVGAGGWIFANTNPAVGWQTAGSPTTANLYAISCPYTSMCIAVGAGGVTIKTVNGGPWTPSCLFAVWARDAGSSAGYDAYDSTHYYTLQ